MQRSVSGARATFIAQFCKFALQIASTVILARVLSPDDFGLIAMISVATGFISVFKDLGLSMATVQRSSISHIQVSSLFWINIFVSLMLMMTAIAIAPVLVWFYGDPRLLWVTVSLSVAFLFAGLTVQHQALMRRQMEFAALMRVDVLALLGGLVVAVSCAVVGLEYWSLVFMQISIAAFTALGVWISCPWRPGIICQKAAIGGMLKFGGYLTSFNVINYFARNLDTVLIGKVLGPQSVGLYSRAYSLLLLPIGQIISPMTAVAVPALSRLQNKPDEFSGFYLKAIKLVAYLTMPLVIGMAVLSNEIVTLVMGDQWVDSAILFTILAFSAFWQPVSSTVGWLYISQGQSRRMFQWVCIASPLISVAFVMGLQWGAVGVASAYSIISFLLVYPNFSYAAKYSPLTVNDILLAISNPLLLSIALGVAMMLVKYSLSAFSSIYLLLVTSLSGIFVFVALIFLFRSTREDLFEVIATSRLAFSRK